MLRNLATGGCALISWRQVTGTTSMGYMNAEAWDFGAHGFLKREVILAQAQGFRWEVGR